MELSTDKLGWDDAKRGQRRPWAIVNKHGAVVFLSLARDEAAMWTWWLGWPDTDDIAAKRREGFRATLVNVTV